MLDLGAHLLEKDTNRLWGIWKYIRDHPVIMVDVIVVAEAHDNTPSEMKLL